jgi:EpsI family protein
MMAKRQAILLIAILVVQVGVFYGSSRNEYVPELRPLMGMPGNFGEWRMVRQTQVEPEVQAELKADDTVVRDYLNPSGEGANLYIAFFKTQRTGVVPHSPKHCLPANGFVPLKSDIMMVDTATGQPIAVNRYIVSRGDTKQMVFYWYQMPHRVVAGEYQAKMYLVADALRYNRTDTALVRVVVNFRDTEQATEKVGLDFIRAAFPALRGYFPS